MLASANELVTKGDNSWMQSNNERKINNCLVVATIVYHIQIGFNTVCIWLNISPDNNVNVMGILFVCQNVLHWCCDYKIDNVALVKTNHILNRTYEIAEIAVFTVHHGTTLPTVSLYTAYTLHIVDVFYFVGTRYEHTAYRLEVDISPKTRFDYKVFFSFLCMHNLAAIPILATFNQNRKVSHRK